MRRAPEEVACGGEADNRLDAGWDPALAPAGFGTFLNDRLAATSTISAFGRAARAFLGHLHDPGGHPVTTNRLRGLAFGTGGLAGDTTTLFFASLTNEADGLSAPSSPTARGAW